MEIKDTHVLVDIEHEDRPEVLRQELLRQREAIAAEREAMVRLGRRLGSRNLGVSSPTGMSIHIELEEEGARVVVTDPVGDATRELRVANIVGDAICRATGPMARKVEVAERTYALRIKRVRQLLENVRDADDPKIAAEWSLRELFGE